MIRVVLIGLDLVVALSAICGGVALATGLESKRFAPSLLEGTPYHSYRPPGLILAIAVGGSAAVALALMFLLPAIAPLPPPWPVGDDWVDCRRGRNPF